MAARPVAREVYCPVDTAPPLGMAAGVASTAVASAVRDANEVRSVDRAASLLIALGEAEAEVGVAELARRLGLHKSTASRLLATLRQRGLVQQDEDSGKYRLGLAVIRLGDRAEKTLDVRAIAMPEVEAVARTVRESTTLGMLNGDRVVAIAWADASGRAHYRMVVSMPLHATAPGKVLLSSGLSAKSFASRRSASRRIPRAPSCVWISCSRSSPGYATEALPLPSASTSPRSTRLRCRYSIGAPRSWPPWKSEPPAIGFHPAASPS